MARKKNKDGCCQRCGRLVPPPRPTPEGWWAPAQRLYCSPDCRAEATKERARRTPSVADVLVACLWAGVEVLPYLEGNQPALTGSLNDLAPEITAGLTRHGREIVAAVARARAVMASYPLQPEHAKLSWLACSRCSEAQAVGNAEANRRCRMTYGCPGRLVIRVVPSVERPGLLGHSTVERASTA
jgi:hypothetical protein